MMKNIGASIIGLADTDNRKIKFSAIYMFTPLLTNAKSWSVNCYNTDDTENPTEKAKVSIDQNGVLSYESNVSTSDSVYVKVHCTADYPNTTNRQSLSYTFKFKELLGE